MMTEEGKKRVFCLDSISRTYFVSITSVNWDHGVDRQLNRPHWLVRSGKGDRQKKKSQVWYRGE